MTAELALSYDHLDARRKELWPQHSDDPLALRMRRAISWIGRADREYQAKDYDAAFIFYWIAFNAAYGDDDPDADYLSERTDYNRYFGEIVGLDRKAGNRIGAALTQEISSLAHQLLHNEFVFREFWQHINGRAAADWKRELDSRNKESAQAFRMGDSRAFLRILFDRLYVLRNQLLHGGATWNSRRNRHQVEDGARILEYLIPLFIDIMLDNPQSDWKNPWYPVVYG